MHGVVNFTPHQLEWSGVRIITWINLHKKAIGVKMAVIPLRLSTVCLCTA